MKRIYMQVPPMFFLVAMFGLFGLFSLTAIAQDPDQNRDIPSPLSAGSRDLLPAVEINPTEKVAERTYIVYYANETDSNSVNRLADWIIEGGVTEQATAAEGLRSDAEKFPAVVADEINQLVSGVSKDKSLGLFVFTNALARQGTFQAMGVNESDPSIRNWTPVKSKLKVFGSHPLAHPASLGMALQSVAAHVGKTEMTKSNFVLITKSHGTSKLAIAQGYSPMHEANSAAELQAIIADLKTAAEQTESSREVVKSEQQMSFDRRLNREETLYYMGDDTLAAGETASTLSASGGSDNATLGITHEGNLAAGEIASRLGAARDSANATLAAGDTTSTAGDTENSTLAAGVYYSDTLGISHGHAAKFLCSGTTKQQLMQAIMQSGKLGMHFDTVFLESCQSELSQQTLQQFRQQEDANIHRLYVSNAIGLRYRTIDYPVLFSLQDGKRFTRVLSEQMDEVARIHVREGLPLPKGKQNDMKIIAHRGASGYLPEHTLPAYSLAYGMGADYIEQDVVLTQDSQAIVLHDIHLDTVTDVAEKFPQRKREDGRWYAIDLTLAEIKTLSVHERANHETGEPVFAARFPKSKSSFQIPTLREAIELVQGLNRSTGRDVGIYPEIKKPKFHRNQNKDISQAVIDILNEYGYRDKTHNIYLQCFDPIELRRLREEMKCGLKLVQLIGSNDWNEASVDYNTLVTAEGIEKIAQYADGIGPWMPYIVKGRTEEGRLDLTELVALAHGKELIVHPFTFRADSLPDYATDFPELIRIFRNAGVDGLFTDHSDQARQAMHASPTKAPNALLFSSRCDPKSDPGCD